MASLSIMQQKEQIVNEIKQKIQESSSVIIVGYQGLNAAQTTKLRADLRAKEVEFKVYKNRLVGKAFQELGYTGLDDALQQPRAFAFCPKSDPASGAKILLEAVKTTGKIEIIKGFIDGVVLDENGVKGLSDMPSKDVLVAKLLGLLQSPISGFIRTLTSATYGGLAVALKAIADNKN